MPSDAVLIALITTVGGVIMAYIKVIDSARAKREKVKAEHNDSIVEANSEYLNEVTGVIVQMSQKVDALTLMHTEPNSSIGELDSNVKQVKDLVDHFVRENQSTVSNISTLSDHVSQTSVKCSNIKEDTNSIKTILMMPKGDR